MKQERIVDSEITLVPFYSNPEVAIVWYQDPEVVRQVDNTEELYSQEKLERMYSFLSKNGDIFYIQYKGRLIGDVALRDNGEVCIVISKEYQNRHIGRRCIENMIALAREKGMEQIKAIIYSFNLQSQRAFEAVGFKKAAEEEYIYKITNKQIS